ncbi:MAG: hypothetical protein AVDCRST_MAG15-1250 [uncultured Rubellimicrobium sp.]|uniref:Uncharacterized protein n=1 Tax=uncultured Rubellimicrobium sp. TaxID=543078 RepID=A0A6J4P6Q1_9RHOB|nr:MAG: hypothetical protein AVDCRST_MAG15-1250 [uncultured Rubellimicrobium sp.]
MIYPLSGLLIGALLGTLGARRRGGKRLDLLQWAAVGAIMGGIVGLFLLVFIERSYAG